jgi:hypothetical protein
MPHQGHTTESDSGEDEDKGDRKMSPDELRDTTQRNKAKSEDHGENTTTSTIDHRIAVEGVTYVASMNAATGGKVLKRTKVNY